METCTKLAEVRRKVEEDEMEGWQKRHLRSRSKGKGDVGVEKEETKEEKMGEKMESFFCSVFEFLTDPIANFLGNHFFVLFHSVEYYLLCFFS